MASLLLSSFTAAAAAVRAARATGAPVKLAPVIASHGGLYWRWAPLRFRKTHVWRIGSVMWICKQMEPVAALQRYAIPSRGISGAQQVGDLCIRNIQLVSADLFSVQSNGAGASRICALLRVWQVHRASMLEDAEVALRRT